MTHFLCIEINLKSSNNFAQAIANFSTFVLVNSNVNDGAVKFLKGTNCLKIEMSDSTCLI